MLASAAALLVVGLARAQAGVEAIPDAHGTLLDGTPIHLSDALKGKTGVLVIGFSQASRVQVSAWGKRLAGQFAGLPNAVWFEVGELEGVPRLLRGFVTKKIRESVSLQGQTTLLLLTDHEKEWKLAAHYSQPDDAYILVVDQAGNIRARAQGALTDGADATITRAVMR